MTQSAPLSRFNEGAAHSTAMALEHTTQSCVKSHLSDFSRGELLRLCRRVADQHPEVLKDLLRVTPSITDQTFNRSIIAIRERIRKLTSSAANKDGLSLEEALSEIEKLSFDLAQLASQGHADALLQLGEILVRQGNLIFEKYADAPNIRELLSQCLRSIIAALPASSLTPNQQLIWLVNIRLEDEQHLLPDEDVNALLALPHYSYEHWESLVEQLEVRLAQRVSATINSKGRRRKILALLVEAYKKTQREDAILPLLTKEVTNSQCYLLLINAFVEGGDRQEAYAWCLAGYQSVSKKSPDLALELRERWCELCLEDGKVHKVAACRAQAFFEIPTIEHYTQLSEASQRARCWQSVRRGVLEYLETGQRPDETYGPTSEHWPLPASEFKAARPILKNNPLAQFPAFNKLIDIALLEGRMDDIASLYRHLEPRGRLGGIQQKVAEALADSHPELSVEICFSLASTLLVDTRPVYSDSRYQEAIVYLERASEVCAQNDLSAAWASQKASLLATYQCRPKLFEMLQLFFQNAATR